MYEIALSCLIKILLIPTTLLGLCAAAMAAPIGFGNTMFASESLREQSVVGLDCIAPDFGYSSDATISQHSAVPIRDLLSTKMAENQVTAPEPPPSVIVMAGFGFFGLAGVLRAVPNALRRLKTERRRPARRRKVKVRIRMMA